MSTVHSYIRFSTEKQSEAHGGTSLERQMRDSAAWVQKNGHTFSPMKFLDLGKSGHKGDKQKALKAFLKAVDDGKVKRGDILLVENVDRLSRKGVRPTQKLVNTILDAGIDIAILSPVEKVYRASEINDIGGTIELAAFAYGAYVYSANLSHRSKAYHSGARNALKTTGQKLKQNRPAWITTANALDEERAEIVRYIFRRTIEGIGAPVLCRELNAKFPPMGHSKNWNSTYVRTIIVGRQAIGEYQPHVLDEGGKRVPAGQPIANYYPAAVDEKTWLAAQDSASHRKIERNPSSGFVNLFTGLLWNVVDDSEAHIQTHTDTSSGTINRRIKSYKAKNNVPGACTATVDMEYFEWVVLNYLHHEIDPATLTVSGGKGAELQAVRGQLLKKEERLGEINSQLAGSDLPVSVLLPAIKALETEIAELRGKERKLAAANANSPEASFAEIVRLNELPHEDREVRQRMREALKQVIEKIYVLPIKLGTKKRDPVVAVIEIAFRGTDEVRTIWMSRKHYISVKGKPFHGYTPWFRRRLTPEMMAELGEQMRSLV